MNPYKFIYLSLLMFTVQLSFSQQLANCDIVSFSAAENRADTTNFIVVSAGIADTTAFMLNGAVFDQMTGKPLEGAEVLLVLKDGRLQDKANTVASGKFKLSLFDPVAGKMSLKVSHSNYKCLSIDCISFKDVNFYEIRIKLNPN